MNCRVCNRQAGDSGYCDLHMRAYENVVGKFECWKKALEVSWKEYLSEIVKNPLTGEWAKEVAEYLSRCEEDQDVTSS